MLQCKHPLAIDTELRFDDDTHTYQLLSTPTQHFTSVTTVSAQWYPPFNATVISAKLAAAARGKYAGKTAAEIRKEWAEAATLGTALHADIETYYNGGAMPCHKGFVRAAALIRHVLRYVPWRSELRMASAATGIAGTADMIFTEAGKKASDGVIIVDWKRTAEAPENCRFDQCRGILSHLPAGKYWKFAAQLNLYKHLLWDTCGVYTKQLLLVLLHPDGSRYDIVHVPEMMEIEAAYQKLKYRHCAIANPTDGGP